MTLRLSLPPINKELCRFPSPMYQHAWDHFGFIYSLHDVMFSQNVVFLFFLKNAEIVIKFQTTLKDAGLLMCKFYGEENLSVADCLFALGELTKVCMCGCVASVPKCSSSNRHLTGAYLILFHRILLTSHSLRLFPNHTRRRPHPNQLRGKYRDARVIYSRCIALRCKALEADNPGIADVLQARCVGTRKPLWLPIHVCSFVYVHVRTYLY